MLTMPEVVSKSVTRAEFFEVGCPAGCKYQTSTTFTTSTATISKMPTTTTSTRSSTTSKFLEVGCPAGCKYSNWLIHNFNSNDIKDANNINININRWVNIFKVRLFTTLTVTISKTTTRARLAANIKPSTSESARSQL